MDIEANTGSALASAYQLARKGQFKPDQDALAALFKLAFNVTYLTHNSEDCTDALIHAIIDAARVRDAD
jgi:hypothetical protein